MIKVEFYHHIYFLTVHLIVSLRTDTVYFHLPPLDGQQKCVYGVSCYRQMEAKVCPLIIYTNY